jgi:tetratricopeptide (TPR) repeat protein
MDATRLPLAAELLPAFQPIRLWSEGQWRELMLMNMEITFEPTGELPPEVEEPLRESVLAMRDHDAAQALPLLERARELGPDIPSVLNNLASAYGALGRDDEAKALSIDVHRRFPEYFFGRVTMARMAIQDGDLETAKAMLKPLLGRRKLHIDEFGALADTEIGLSQALGEHQAAESWLKIWEGIDPDDPRIENWRLRLRLPNLLRDLERISLRSRKPRKSTRSGDRKPRGQR